jgi:hypothetical protein
LAIQTLRIETIRAPKTEKGKSGSSAKLAAARERLKNVCKDIEN